MTFRFAKDINNPYTNATVNGKTLHVDYHIIKKVIINNCDVNCFVWIYQTDNIVDSSNGVIGAMIFNGYFIEILL